MLHKEVFHADVIERRIDYVDLVVEILVLGITMVIIQPRLRTVTSKTKSIDT